MTDEMELINAMVELIDFHELDTVDSRAVELKLRAKALKEKDNSSLYEWIESVRQANMHELT